MYKIIIILYFICFSFYILFTRQPDYFDSEFTNAKIHYVKENNSKLIIPEAVFSAGSKTFAVDAGYIFKTYKEGENVPIIYESEQPPNAAVYSVWGYWLRWKELLASAILFIGLFQIAVAITSHPTPEGLISEIENSLPKKRKYK
ncbi:MAG: hypothetical protein ACR2FN_11590 [Chitinophagaceae bacterium]